MRRLLNIHSKTQKRISTNRFRIFRLISGELNKRGLANRHGSNSNPVCLYLTGLLTAFTLHRSGIPAALCRPHGSNSVRTIETIAYFLLQRRIINVESALPIVYTIQMHALYGAEGIYAFLGIYHVLDG